MKLFGVLVMIVYLVALCRMLTIAVRRRDV
jgi:hypothetical protein